MSLSKLEEGIRKEAESIVETTLKSVDSAIRQYLYMRAGVNGLSLKSEQDLDEVKKLVINALAGDSTSQDKLVDNVVDTATKNLIRKAL